MSLLRLQPDGTTGCACSGVGVSFRQRFVTIDLITNGSCAPCAAVAAPPDIQQCFDATNGCYNAGTPGGWTYTIFYDPLQIIADIYSAINSVNIETVAWGTEYHIQITQGQGAGCDPSMFTIAHSIVDNAGTFCADGSGCDTPGAAAGGVMAENYFEGQTAPNTTPDDCQGADGLWLSYLSLTRSQSEIAIERFWEFFCSTDDIEDTINVTYPDYLITMSGGLNGSFAVNDPGGCKDNFKDGLPCGATIRVDCPTPTWPSSADLPAAYSVDGSGNPIGFAGDFAIRLQAGQCSDDP